MHYRKAFSLLKGHNQRFFASRAFSSGSWQLSHFYSLSTFYAPSKSLIEVKSVPSPPSFPLTAPQSHLIMSLCANSVPLLGYLLSDFCPSEPCRRLHIPLYHLAELHQMRPPHMAMKKPRARTIKRNQLRALRRKTLNKVVPKDAVRMAVELYDMEKQFDQQPEEVLDEVQWSTRLFMGFYVAKRHITPLIEG
jgi:hypothetical protein